MPSFTSPGRINHLAVLNLSSDIFTQISGLPVLGPQLSPPSHLSSRKKTYLGNSEHHHHHHHHYHHHQQDPVLQEATSTGSPNGVFQPGLFTLMIYFSFRALFPLAIQLQHQVNLLNVNCSIIGSVQTAPGILGIILLLVSHYNCWGSMIQFLQQNIILFLVLDHPNEL